MELAQRRLPPGGERALTEGECALIATMFGAAVDPGPVRIRRRRWFPLQPRSVVMAPCGHVHFHPHGGLYRDDFAAESAPLQAFFLHEITHVWQSQQRGRYYLPFARHPFCRYHYSLVQGRAFTGYGIEQQAEIVRHAHLARLGRAEAGQPAAAALEAVLPFTPAFSRPPPSPDAAAGP